MVNKLIKKLRTAADALEDLFVDAKNQNEKVAKKIIKEIKRKKFTKENPHWTQTARGKKIMSKWGKRENSTKN